MRTRHSLAVGMAFSSLLTCALPAIAANDYKPPRMPDGKPSLQGTWSNSSITRLTRSRDYDELIISEQDILALTDNHPQVVRQRTDDGLDPENGLLDGKDLGRGRGYNAFWIDPGQEYGLVNDTRRSRWIVDPADGNIPYKKGQPPPRDMTARSQSEGPEARSLGERCLVGFGGTGGPPMLNTLYNNTYQIVQTPDYVMILVEMVHDARIIPIGKNKKHGNIGRWLGDSIGWWDGDTLVVETTNWHDNQINTGPVYVSAKGKVTERFSRYSDNQITYEFTVEDSSIYTQPWRGEMSFNATDGQVYEYSCHEGNIGMEGILQGARAEEEKEK